MNSALLRLSLLHGGIVTFKPRTHFEQVPLEIVKKIAKIDERQLRSPSWQELYQAALTEPDTQKLTELVLAIEAAMFSRAQQLDGTAAGAGERAAMAQAARHLLCIKTEKLGWPAPSLGTTQRSLHAEF